VQVRNSSEVGLRGGTGVGANNLSGVDLGEELNCLNFLLALSTELSHRVCMVICRTAPRVHLVMLYLWSHTLHICVP
jgi:hypothetical protein